MIYDNLREVLREAADRAESGKGAERHGGKDIAFEEQPMFTIVRELQADEAPHLFQAVKKIYESRRLPPCQSRNELLDAIVYIAAAVMHSDGQRKVDIGKE